MAPWRCTICGCETVPVIHGSLGGDAAVTQLDPRYATRWCGWCKHARESVRAASVAEATARKRQRPAPAAADPPDQLRGGWS